MPDTEILRVALNEVVDGLTDIGWKHMFGCGVVFRNGTIFGLIWKDGRIGLKFVDATEFESRMATDGSDRWCPSGWMTKHWILVSKAVASDAQTLKEWAESSHSSII
jgi:TfoX/Sxy family transcriptional regulator of competence genes